MVWIECAGIAGAVIAAVMIASTGPAYADAVPTTDQVLAVLAKMTDPGIPAASKTDIVTPGFTPDEAQTIDDHLNRMEAFGGLLPINFVVTDIQPAPANMAGATVATTGGRTSPQPVVLVDHGGHWLLTHDTAMAELDALWNAAQRTTQRHVPVIPCCHGH